MSATPEREQAEALALVRWAESAYHFGPEDFGKLRSLAAAVSRMEAERDEAKSEAQIGGEYHMEVRLALAAVGCEAAFVDDAARMAAGKIEALVERERELKLALAAGRPPEQDEAKPSKCTCTPPFFEDDCRAVGRCIFQVPYSHAAVPEVLPEETP